MMRRRFHYFRYAAMSCGLPHANVQRGPSIPSYPALSKLFLTASSTNSHTFDNVPTTSCDQVNTIGGLLSSTYLSFICPPTPASKLQARPRILVTSASHVSSHLGSGPIRAFEASELGFMFIRTHMGHAHNHGDRNHKDETGEAGERVSRLGLLADICLTAVKGFAGYASGSTAVIADAAHSMSDVVLSGVALWIFKAARAPKDQMHPYGHGKFETLGALAISTMLLATGGGIAWHAFEILQDLLSATDVLHLSSSINSGPDYAKLFTHEHAPGGHHHEIDKEHQGLALTATLISIGVKEGLYWITKKVGDARGSELLKANAWHHRSDAISSVIALLGVGGAMLGWHFLDPLAALVVSGLIVRAGLQTGYRSLQELVDSALPESVLSHFKETVLSVKGVKGCHALRGRRAGSSVHLDVHIEVDPWLSVSAAHMIGEAVRGKLRDNHPLLEEIFIHIDPADAFASSTSSNEEPEGLKGHGHMQTDKSYQQQEVEDIVRGVVQSHFEKMMAFERVRCHFLQGRLLVELEVSMDPTISIKDGMLYARQAEQLIMKSDPKISAVETQLRLTRCM